MPGDKLKLSKEELDNILLDYEKGFSLLSISKKYHHNPNTLKKYFKENNIDIILRNKTEGIKASPKKKIADELKRKYQVNDTYFSNQNSKMAYFLGFLMADGNVSKTNNRIQVCLSEEDSEYLNIFYIEIGGTPVAHYITNNGKQKICRWQCLSSKIKQDLIAYDIIPNKTGFAKIPEKLDKKFFPDFIRGYFDGDGSIYVEKNGVVGFELTSHNTEILEQVINYFEENGIPKVKIKTDNRSNINYSFKYRKTACKKIYNILYNTQDCICMKRKFDKFKLAILEK